MLYILLFLLMIYHKSLLLHYLKFSFHHLLQLQFHQLLSTRMACPNQSQEMALLVALEEVEWAKQESEGAKILMFNSKGKEVLELEKIERENN